MPRCSGTGWGRAICSSLPADERSHHWHSAETATSAQGQSTHFSHTAEGSRGTHMLSRGDRGAVYGHRLPDSWQGEEGRKGCSCPPRLAAVQRQGCLHLPHHRHEGSHEEGRCLRLLAAQRRLSVGMYGLALPTAAQPVTLLACCAAAGTGTGHGMRLSSTARCRTSSRRVTVQIGLRLCAACLSCPLAPAGAHVQKAYPSALRWPAEYAHQAQETSGHPTCGRAIAGKGT